MLSEEQTAKTIEHLGWWALDQRIIEDPTRSERKHQTSFMLRLLSSLR